MSLKKLFGTNKEKEESGTWIDISVNEDGNICRMRLARMTARNKEFMAKVAKANKTKRNTTIRKNETPIASKEDVAVAIDVFVNSILLGWENVEEYRTDVQRPKLMEFNQENAKFLLTDLPDLFELLTTEAVKLENSANLYVIAGNYEFNGGAEAAVRTLKAEKLDGFVKKRSGEVYKAIAPTVTPKAAPAKPSSSRPI